MRDLAGLLGRYVRVTNPDVEGASWEGVLQGLADMPSLILDMPDGHRVVLPQRFTVEEIPASTERSEAEIRAQALREASVVARGRGHEDFAQYLAGVAEEIDPSPLATDGPLPRDTPLPPVSSCLYEDLSLGSVRRRPADGEREVECIDCKRCVKHSQIRDDFICGGCGRVYSVDQVALLVRANYEGDRDGLS